MWISVNEADNLLLFDSSRPPANSQAGRFVGWIGKASILVDIRTYAYSQAQAYGTYRYNIVLIFRASYSNGGEKAGAEALDPASFESL